MQFVDVKANWRLYGAVVCGLALGVADKAGVKVPTLVSWAIAIFGNSQLREAIRAQSAESAEDIIVLVNSVLAQLSTTVPKPVDPNIDVTGEKAPLVPVETRELPPPSA